jgi:PncC family amidohydrolase
MMLYMVEMDLEIELGKVLKQKNLTIATAESCTGGLIANRITNIPGSSEYFDRGVVTYSNQSKIDILGVSAEIIDKFGAVSQETAKAMAESIKRIGKTDIGLAVTGIAGPSGGTPEKPVGLVYVGLAMVDSVKVFKFNFTGARLEIKRKTADEAIKAVINLLGG